MALWVFGYGSLIWKAGFKYDDRVIGFIKGYRRVFYQGSTDHRGTPEYPGRTVTLEPAPGEICWGVAYKTTEKEDQEIAITYLEVREKQYDQKLYLEFFTDINSSVPAISDVLVYVGSSDKKINKNYLGPAPLKDIASQIVRAHGPSGPNRDYLFHLEDALKQLGCIDKHISDLADEQLGILWISYIDIFDLDLQFLAMDTQEVHSYMPRDLQLSGHVTCAYTTFTVNNCWYFSALFWSSCILHLDAIRFPVILQKPVSTLLYLPGRRSVSTLLYLPGRRSVVRLYFRWLHISRTNADLEQNHTGKEYSKGDLQYMSRDSAVFAVEGITVVLEGPACIIAPYAIGGKKPYSYLIWRDNFATPWSSVKLSSWWVFFVLASTNLIRKCPFDSSMECIGVLFTLNRM
ncbi:hypothetical protein LIER_04010 [Lithospermum erythrorhizon]|uniref:glutathione-specific gamma-glutamylcyclotransferase n=1 Tax=Lithospermum erythrorhizon TaxID=34254 RepID=A0AAV3NVA3_LITER